MRGFRPSVAGGSRATSIVLRLGKRHALSVLAVLTAGLALVASGAAEPPAITQKKAEQQHVLDQIAGIDHELERATEAYNGATYRLSKIRADLKANEARLRLAKRNYAEAQRRVEARLVELYESDESSSVAAILVGAQSLNDLLDRIDAVGRISEQDAEIVREVETYRREVQQRERSLKASEAAQKREVARRASERSAIESKLAERKRLLSSIQGEIQRLEAQERERQARLAEQARQELAAQKKAHEQEQQQETQAQTDTTETTQAPTTTQSQTDSAPQQPSSSGGSGSTSSSPPPPSPSGGGSPAPSGRGARAAQIALHYLGVPYVWGGASPSGFDCSGFTMYVYAQVGVSLPHYAAAQYGMGTPVSRGSLQAGDLVFFAGLSHVGIYIGGGRFVHAPHTGDVVKISSLSESWYASNYVGARRF